MSMRPKTKRRLAILLVAALLLAGVVFALKTITDSQAEARRLAAREEGIRLFQQGEYAAALEQFRVYNPRNERDVEALFALASSRRMVEQPNRGHLHDAAQALAQLLILDPGHEPAARLLMDVYTEIPLPTEAIAAADRILAIYPDDIDALYAKGLALMRQQRFDAALPVAEQAARIDIKGVWLRFEILQALRVPAEEVLRQATEEMQANPDDPRYELLMAFAHSYAADQPDAAPATARRHRQEAIRLLRAAAVRPPTDPAFARQLIQALDSYSLVAEAHDLLERTAAQADEPEIGRMLIVRLWQTGAAGEVVQRLQALNPQDPAADGELLAYYALSLHDLERTSEALAVARALAERQNDPQAAGWGIALNAYFRQDEVRPREQIAQYRDALSRAPRNAVVRVMLGEAYAQLQETELAIQEWRRASNDMPGWAAPQILIARTLAHTGRGQQAIEQAQEAFAKAPNQIAAHITLAIAHSARVDRMTPEQQRELLQLVQNIQQHVPDGEPETLPLYVRLLVITGQAEQADEVLEQVLHRPAPLPQQTLLRLADLAGTLRLDRERDLLEHLRQHYGMTPALALRNAVRRYQLGESDAALAELRRAAAQGGENHPQWQLALAQFMELISHPDAGANWQRIGEQFPENLQIQQAVFQSAAAIRDREFARRSIDRLRTLTGDEGNLWKQEYARWLLMSDQSGDREVAEAVHQLVELLRTHPQLTEPRWLYAIAMQRLGNIDAAIEQLQIIGERAPAAGKSRLALASLLVQQGRFNEAHTELDRLSQTEELSTEQRRQAAGLYARIGAGTQATRLLEGLGGDADHLFLAELHRRQGQFRQAEAIYQRLLESSPPSAAVIQSAADFYAATGRTEEAQQVLNRLEQAQARPGQAELILGDFHERYGDADQAQRYYESAAAAAPQQSQPWRQLVGFYSRRGEYQRADEAAGRAVQTNPDRAEFETLKRQTAALAQAAQAVRPDLRPLIQELAPDAQNPAAAEALEIIHRAAERGASPQQTLNELRDLSRRHVQFYQLRRVLVRGYLAINRVEDAVEIAAASISDFPTLAEPAMLATQANAAARRYPQMLATAQIWRQRTLERPFQADLAIAEANLHLNEPARAMQQIEPYLSAAMQQPDEEPRVLLLQAQALIRVNRSDDAASLLMPLAQQSEQWRARYLVLAPLHRDANQAQQWLASIEPLIAAGGDPDRIMLARAWFDVGRMHRDPAAFEQARTIARPLADAEPPDPTALLLVASVAHEQDDPATAESAYRRFLSIQPDHPAVKNNLASLLARQQNFDEALRLAQEAVAQAPSVAGIHDTLGQIFLSTQRHNEAIRAFEAARSLDPGHLEASVGLADALIQINQPGRAAEVLRQIDRLIGAGTEVTPALEQRLLGIREAASAN